MVDPLVAGCFAAFERVGCFRTRWRRQWGAGKAQVLKRPEEGRYKVIERGGDFEGRGLGGYIFGEGGNGNWGWVWLADVATERFNGFAKLGKDIRHLFGVHGEAVAGSWISTHTS